jgi:protein-S-isoprenylcysteine O-methyltransferase Ste14
MTSSRRTRLTIAWTGAGVFAASLAWFVYSYLVRFGRPAPPGRVLPALVANVLLFSLFALHHSVLARSGAKHVIRRVVPAGLERSLYTWVASLLFLGVCTWWQPVPGVVYELDGLWRAGAWAVQLAGLVLTIRASSAIDVLDLAGVRAIERALGTKATASPPLTTGGVYAVVRHPVYFAWALFVLGAPTMTATRACFAVISTAYLMIAIPWEEQALVETFGQDYEAYRRRVRSRMIPGLY